MAVPHEPASRHASQASGESWLIISVGFAASSLSFLLFASLPPRPHSLGSLLYAGSSLSMTHYGPTSAEDTLVIELESVVPEFRRAKPVFNWRVWSSYNAQHTFFCRGKILEGNVLQDRAATLEPFITR